MFLSQLLRLQDRLTRLALQWRAQLRDRDFKFWYENPFWGTSGIAVTIYLTALGFGLLSREGSVTRWLFVLTWSLAVIASWCAAESFRQAVPRYVSFCLLALLVTTGLYFSNQWLQRHQKELLSHTETVPLKPDSDQNPSGHADLKLEFIGKDKLQFLYSDDSDESANQPKRFFGLWDIERPFQYPQLPGVVQALPLVTKTESDFVFRHSKQGPQDVLDSADAIGHVKHNDTLFGIAYVVCSNCQKFRFYWIYFKSGSGGWYAESDRNLWGQSIQVPKEDSTESTRTAIFDREVVWSKNSNGLKWRPLRFCTDSLFEWASPTQKRRLQSRFTKL